MAEERYALKKQLGVGGMGEVWLATDTLLDRPVAVKFLQATDDQMYKDLFLSEARTLASLHHPNITLIYDAVFDEDENRFYIMMEYVEGESLASMIEKSSGPLPFETIFEVTMGVLRALKYAHDKGLVHRDIKPENIVIQKDEVKLTDFGLASLVSILAEAQGEFMFGTPTYMPPEQIVSQGVDGRADLYALGVTLFEMVTGGRLPFEFTERHELLRAHIEDAPLSVRQFEPTAPLMLDRIILKLLAKHPDDRYPSAEAVLDIFKSFHARRRFSQRYLQLLDPDAKPLVGRAKELAKIETTWAETQEYNKPDLLVVRGEMGLGKSRLIAEFLGNSIIDKGLETIVGRCSEVGAPYTPFAEVLATIFDRGIVKPSTIENQLDRVVKQIPSLASLLNIELEDKAEQDVPPITSSGLWQTLSKRVPKAEVQDPIQAQWQLFSAILTVLVELGPAVIFLDDAVFMDESSVALIRFLLRQEQLPLLLIAELDKSNQNPWLDTLSASEVETIDLSPLSSKMIKQYLVNFLEGPVSKVVVSIVEKRSRGNPFHIEELTRQLVDAGDVYRSETDEWRYKPPDDTTDLTAGLLSPFLQSAFTRRLEKLTEKNREVLTLAAILEPGPKFDFDIWLALLGGEDQRPVAMEALNEALNRRLLRAIDDTHYSFRPADVSKALTASLTPSRQRELHHQAAKILKSKQSDPILIGYHYEQAGQATESVHYLETAGARAMAANATTQAINYYNRAIELIETVSGYASLGNLYRQRGAWSDSINAFQRALELTKNTDDIDERAQILNELSFTLWLADKYREASQFASSILKLQGVSQIEHAIAQSNLGLISWVMGHLVEAERWCRKSVDLLVDSGDEPKLAAAYNRLGLVYFSLGKFEQAVKVTNRSLEIRKKSQNYWGEGYCLMSLGRIAIDRGNFKEAETHLNLAEQLFKKINSKDGQMIVYTEQGRNMLHQGQAGESMLVIGQALHRAQELDKGNSYNLADIYLLIAQASLTDNQLERARTNVDNALKLVESAGNQQHIAVGWSILAQIYAAEGNSAEAEKMYTQALKLFGQVRNPAGLLRTKLNYAHFLAAQGHSQQATDLEQEARAEAAKIGLHL